ncbi:unnamed protein product [Pylaiella littoralis]
MQKTHGMCYFFTDPRDTRHRAWMYQKHTPSKKILVPTEKTPLIVVMKIWVGTGQRVHAISGLEVNGPRNAHAFLDMASIDRGLQVRPTPVGDLRATASTSIACPSAKGNMVFFTRLRTDCSADGRRAGWRGCHGRTLLGGLLHTARSRRSQVDGTPPLSQGQFPLEALLVI